MATRTGATVVLERSFAFPLKALEIDGPRAGDWSSRACPRCSRCSPPRADFIRFDLGALRMITNTAAALTEDHIRRLRGLFPQATLFSMYGLTECKRVTYLLLIPHGFSTAFRRASDAACPTRRCGSSTTPAGACPTATPASS